MSELRWVIALTRRRPGRLLAVAAGIAVGVALISSVGTFVRDARQSMTTRSISQVAVDWQVETQPGADPVAVLDQVRRTAGVANALPVAFATTPGLHATLDGASFVTGPGVVVGLPVDYSQEFPGSIRVIAGAAGGVVLPQQTAANLHATPGSVVSVQRPGLDDLAITVTGIVELQQADSLFQRVGQPPTAQPQVPPDNVVVLPLDAWHQAFDPLASQRPELVRQQVHARLDRQLADDPAAALNTVQGAAHHLDVVLAGSGVVADNLAAALDAARSDSLYAQVLFLFLGLPGVCIACVLAAALTAVPGASRRHEQELLRARGASRSRLIRFAAAEGAAVGIVGAATGILLGLAADRYLGPSSSGVSSFDLAWNAVSAVAGIAVAIAVLTASAWRDARSSTVASARRTVPRRWQRSTVAAIGLGLGLIGLWVYAVARRPGYTLVFAPEGIPSISVSYWALVGPAALWIAAALLTYELSAAALDRGRALLGRAARPVAGNLAPTVAATMRRQRMNIARTLMLIALTIAFAASTAAFNQTYQQQADIDAKLTKVADVTVTSATHVGFAPAVGTQLGSIPGVAHIEPLLTGLARIELAYALLLIFGAAGLALALGLTERRRSFAIATALGATRKQVGAFAWTEAALVTGAGIGAGLVIAWLISNVLVAALTGVFDPPPQGPVLPWAYLIAMLACAALAVAASTIVAVRLARRSPVSMLRAT